MFTTVIFTVLLGVVWGFVAAAAADPNVAAEYVALVTLTGGVFTIGGLWQIAAEFGLVKPVTGRTFSGR